MSFLELTYFFLVGTCSANTSTQYFSLNSRMNRGSLQYEMLFELIHKYGKVHVPKFTGNTKILTAPHQSIAFACLRCRWNTRRVKVILFSPSDGDKSRFQSTGAFSALTERQTYLPWQTRAYSRLTIFGLTLVSPRGASPQAPGPNALLRTRRYLISGK